MLNWIYTSKWYRQYLANKTEIPFIKRYLLEYPANRDVRVIDTPFLVVDFETTGLNAKIDHILSAGYTTIRNGRILMAENIHQIVQVDMPLPKESVSIHKITDTQSEQGEILAEVMRRLIESLTGKVMIAHFSSIERTFFHKACMQLYGLRLPLAVIDTFQIERRKRVMRHQVIQSNDLRLFNLRKNYGLPRYNAHNALEDAIATAELFLIQITQKQSDLGRLKISDL